MFKKWLPVILAGILFLGGYQSIDSIDDIDDIRSLFESTAGADEHSKPAGQQEYDVILEFPADRYPETAAHIQGAIKKGHSEVCTIDRDGADQNREESLQGIPTKEGYDRDEWPMAFCSEGGKGAHIAYIDPADNRGAGSWVSHQTRDYPDGTRIKFVVTQPEGATYKVFYSYLWHTTIYENTFNRNGMARLMAGFFIHIQWGDKFSRSENHNRARTLFDGASSVWSPTGSYFIVSFLWVCYD
ncbi:hypothetical protein GCM10007416_35150 [Kroppenstedtia guangzhouensis]|uniref:Uncharacterized protein n=1 Tax=Kroppenstedtia guangzhouensis TaxID=1274356 RepID=A0ABQ1H548_9BACL|nr:hypothetical protein GCM10007416_35150 [Kroppenstedtia guangzhouensis]